MIGRAVFWLSVVCAFSPGSHAFNPLDDDAASGGDAPDNLPDSLFIPPGEYHGHLFAPLDRTDVYSFDGFVGTAVAFSLESSDILGIAVHDPGGRLYQVVDATQEALVYIKQDGAWFVSIYTFSPFSHRLSYSFALGKPRSVNAAFLEQASPGIILEATVEHSSRLTMLVTLFASYDDLTEPFSGLISMEYRLDSPSGELLGDGQTHVGQTAFESNFSAVAIGKLAPSVEMSFPNATVLWAQYYVDLEDVHGSIRLIGYATGSNTRIKLSIVSAGEPILLKSRPIEHVVIWGDDHTAQVHLTSPIMSVNGPRNTTLHLDGTFLGFFNTWGFPGEVTAPDGTKEELGFPNSWKLLKFPEQGPWTFSLDFSGGFLGNTRHYYLDGVFLPSLGIWAPG